MLRPKPARWFEILTAREDATLVLEALARTGAVELEARPSAALPPEFSALAPGLQKFEELAQRYRDYWPTDGCLPSAFPESPPHALERALGTIRAWAQQAEPMVRELQRLDAERERASLWREAIAALDAATLDLSQLPQAGPLLAALLAVHPAGVEPAAAAALLIREVDLEGGRRAALVAGSTDDVDGYRHQAEALKARVCDAPAWLAASRADSLSAADARLAALGARSSRLRESLEALHEAHGLRCVLADVYRLQWLIGNVRALESGELLCWITGWSVDDAGGSIAQALQRCGARALAHHPPPPPGMTPPLVLANPAWAAPFEFFSRALGMPAAADADPSQLLAIVVPLLFGFMFGDVGQGLVLAAVGWWLRDRLAVGRLLFAGGLAAIAFGFAFGSVFGLHGLVPALWLQPLDQPLTVLVVPLAAGAVLLLIGIGLDGLQAHWRGRLREWIVLEAPLVPVYLGVLAAFADARLLLVAALGVLLHLAGHALHARRAGAAFVALGELLEKTLQILINTLSFARVGAFALAHAGLSSAIESLMQASDNTLVRALVLIAGNAVVLVLEALVVSIQTTRLVLFEFFIRFVSAGGRSFRPLPAPPVITQETRR